MEVTESGKRELEAADAANRAETEPGAAAQPSAAAQPKDQPGAPETR